MTAGQLSSDVGALAHQDLSAVAAELFLCAPFTGRVWELKDTVTSCDAW